VNRVLRRAYDRIMPVIADRYDPFMRHAADHPTPADGTTATQLVASWREGVWRNTEHLATAHAQPHRAVAAEAIERNAHGWAVSIAAAEKPGHRAIRAAHCGAWQDGRR
jgi:hypothetical protein